MGRSSDLAMCKTRPCCDPAPVDVELDDDEVCTFAAAVMESSPGGVYDLGFVQVNGAFALVQKYAARR